MKKLLTAAAALSVLGAVVPFVSRAAEPTTTARVADELAASLATASPDERFLVFVHGATRGDAVRGVDAAGLVTVGELQSIGVPVAAGTAAEIDELAGEPGITYIEGDRSLSPMLDTSRTAIRADEAITTTFATTTTDKEHGKGKGKGHETTTAVGPFDGSGQSIAIVDSGVDGTHPMFADGDGGSRVVKNLKVMCVNHIPGITLEPLGVTDPDACPGEHVDDGEANEPFIVDMTSVNDTDTPSAGGHGTHVASIAAGGPVTSEDTSFSGVAPGAKVVALSMGAVITIYGENAALDWIVRHHDDPCGDGSCPPIEVVNNSYGNTSPWDPEAATSRLQQELIDAGVVMVWANGNAGGDGTSSTSGSDAQHPAPGIISVANYDDGGTGTRDGVIAESSSRGAATDPTSWPDVSAPGTDITAACRPYLAVCSAGADPNYGTISGTSMAAPHVAGVVAILRQANPALTPGQIELLLQNTAYRFTAGAAYGVDTQNTGSPSTYDKGHGLVDVVNALRVALALPPEVSTPLEICVPGGPVITDPADDATSLVLVGAGPNEPALDLRDLAIAWDDATKTLRFTLSVTELGDANPDTSPNAAWNVTFDYGGNGYYVEAIRSASGETSFGYGFATTIDAAVTSATVREPAGATTGAFDVATSSITIELPSSLLEAVDAAPLATGAHLDAITLVSRRSATDREIGQGPGADDATAACSYVLGTGPAPTPLPPPPAPPQGDADATLQTGKAWTTDGVTPSDTTDGTPLVGGYECAGPDDPRCITYTVAVQPNGPSNLVAWINPDPAGTAVWDYDLYIYNDKGQQVGSTAGPQTVTEGVLGALVGVSGPGVYSIVVAPYFVPKDQPFTVKAELRDAS